MKIRHALAGLLAAVAMVGAAPAALAATPTAATPGNIYNEATPAHFYADAAPGNIYNEAGPGNIYNEAAPATKPQAVVAACPAPGHRIKTSSSAVVFLVGPRGVLYFFANSAEYFGLYSSYSGIKTVSQSVLSACAAQSPNSKPYELPGLLAKSSSSPRVYIADPHYAGGWRWITSQSIFDTYGFDSTKILRASVSPTPLNWS